MAVTDAPRTRQVPYDRARILLVAAGGVALLLVAAVMLVRGVDTVEVWAAVLFIPVFVGFMFGGWIGGVVVGVLAGAAYAGLRAPAIDAVGFDTFGSLIISRSIAYVMFGAIGGYANQQLEASLTKLDLYDQIDDATGLNNARSFLIDIDLERARAARYKTFFSVCVVDVPDSPLAALGRRRRSAILRALGVMLREAVRSVDHPVHARTETHHRFAVILPETAHEGAQVFGSRLAANLGAALRERGAKIDDLEPTLASYPGGEGAMDALRATFAEVERHEHPESATT